MNHQGAIYLIKNNITEKCYVGQTRQKVNTRWCNHKTKLNSGTHHSKKLQKEWVIYGQEAFDFVEIFNTKDRAYLNDVEKQIIEEIKPFYNMTSGGAGSKDRVISDAERELISKRLKSKWKDPVWKSRQIELLKKAHKTDAALAQIKAVQHLGTLKRWEGHTKKEKKKASTTQSQRTKASWEDEKIRAKRIESLKQRYSDPAIIEKRRALATGKVMSRESVERSAKAKWKPVLCLELNISFLSMAFAAEYLNVKRSTISEAVKRKRKVSGAYTFIRVT